MNVAEIDSSAGAFQSFSIDYHEMMAKAMTISRAVSSGGHYLKYLTIAKDFWSLSRQFSDLLAHLNQIRNAPAADLEALVAKLQDLHRGLGDLVVVSKSKGLLNRSLTAPSVRAVMAKNEDFLDLIDAFEVSLKTSTKEDFDAALREYEAGETVSLKSLHF